MDGQKEAEPQKDDQSAHSNQEGLVDRGEVERLLEQIHSRLVGNGPAVIVSAVVAFVDDERKPDLADRSLSMERAVKVRNLIHCYRNWFEAYWHERIARNLADEAGAQLDGSPRRDELYNLLGSFLAAIPQTSEVGEGSA